MQPVTSTVRRTLDGDPAKAVRISNVRCTYVRRALEMAFSIVSIGTVQEVGL